jgi:uncharacterized protein DUF6448
MSSKLAAVLLLTAGLGLQSTTAFAHCDALDGPLVQAARTALEANNVALVLPWVPSDQELAVRDAFARTMAVRALSSDARALADTWFFETVVRIHRAAEGAAFEGLKPAGHIEPFVAEIDRALITGLADEVIGHVNAEVARGVRDRFVRAREARARADASVEAGRKYVAAYVEYIHYIERVRDAGGITGHELTQGGEHQHSH